MNIIHQGKQRRFVGASIGDTPFVEIWKGDKKIWPNMEGLAHRIYVELPKQGTRDWQYWVHALDAVSTAAAPNNYMKFVVDGLDFYINHSLDGSEPYVLDSNALTADLDGVLVDQLGTELVVEAKIASRSVLLHESFWLVPEYEDTINLPILQGTKSEWLQWGNKSGAHTELYETYISQPSGTYLLKEKLLYKSGRSPRTYSSEIPASVVGDTSTDVKLRFRMTKHTGGANDYKIIHPSFTYTFKLPIISVEQYADKSSI